MGEFWEKAGKMLNNFNDYLMKQNEEMLRKNEQKRREAQRVLASKPDNEIKRIFQNPNLSEPMRELVEQEMRKRGL